MSYFVINGAKVQRILRITDFFFTKYAFQHEYLVPFL